MTWTPTQTGQLLALAEAGALSPAQLGEAAEIAALAPSRSDWLGAADRLLAFAGALLLAAGLIFFFAYNWAELHRFVRIGIALAALAACVGTAGFCAPFGTAYRAALLGASLCLGALLALIGQIYQSGADVWELFVAWAALMTPFALLARSSGSWALWLLVANAGLMRGLSESAWFRFVGVLGDPASLFAIAVLNLAVLSSFEAFGGTLLAIGRRHVHRLAALGMVAPLAAGATIGWWEARYLPLALAFAAVAAAMLWAYLKWRRDVPMLALATFAGIAVLTSALARALPQSGHFIELNLLALFVIAGSGFAAVWLTRLYREGQDA